jgi:iron complex transport system permease protein
MKKGSPWLVVTLFLTLAAVLSLAVGSVSIPFADVFRSVLARIVHLPDPISDTAATILYQLRLPRTMLVALVGASLAGSGSAYQGLFRNPLADPYLIGVASGAGLGAVVAMSIQWPNGIIPAMLVPAAAFISGLLTILIVYSLARVNHSVPTTNLLLAGVAISSLANAITSFLMMRSQGELHRATAWMLGGSSLSGWVPVFAILPYVILGLSLLIVCGHQMNVLQMGDEQARQLGVPVDRVKIWVVIAASLTAAAAVAFAGIIGFVGLIVPHIIRILWGSNYKQLIPLSIIGGAGFLLVADVLARILLAPQEIPLGIITALFGAPFFLWILRISKKQAFW